MLDKAVVISADTWEMPDKLTNKLVKGISFWYFNQYRKDTETSLGQRPTKLSVPLDMWSSFTKGPLPAVFEMGFSSRYAKENKAALVLVSMQYLKSLTFAEIYDCSKVFSAASKV